MKQLTKEEKYDLLVLKRAEKTALKEAFAKASKECGDANALYLLKKKEVAELGIKLREIEKEEDELL